MKPEQAAAKDASQNFLSTLDASVRRGDVEFAGMLIGQQQVVGRFKLAAFLNAKRFDDGYGVDSRQHWRTLLEEHLNNLEGDLQGAEFSVDEVEMLKFMSLVLARINSHEL
jgi:hypothetical protein